VEISRADRAAGTQRGDPALESARESLQTELGLASGAEPNLGSMDFLFHVPSLPAPAPAKERRSFGCPDSGNPIRPAVSQNWSCSKRRWSDSGQARAATASDGVNRFGRHGHLVGGDRVEARGTAEVGVSMPLFDAGTISRGIEKMSLRRDLAQRNVRILARSLTWEVQSTLATLGTARSEAEQRRAECEEVRDWPTWRARRGAGTGRSAPALRAAGLSGGG